MDNGLLYRTETMAAILVGPSQNYCFGVDVLENVRSAFGFKWERMRTLSRYKLVIRGLAF